MLILVEIDEYHALKKEIPHKSAAATGSPMLDEKNKNELLK